ncbi:enoyl-CoA hydratase/isomerase family protein [bacterium]|nr:enoyl-CoA hydratase/isomerase family protein [bacterium]
MIDLTRTGPVFVLAMQSGENRFNRAFLDALNGAVDEVERSRGAAALVTVGSDKFYSNGLDLDWLMSPAGEGPSFIGDFLAFFGRLLALPVPTVAAINGHAFAGGAMFALTHDFRVMRADRGFFCLPEVDLGMPFAPGMNALITGKLGRRSATDLILTGRRVGGAEALALRAVDETAAAEEVLPRAVARAEALSGKDRAIYGRLKRDLFAEAIELLATRRMP